MLQERQPDPLVMRENHRGERISRRTQPTAERVRDHGHVVATGVDVRQHEQHAAADDVDVARKDDRADARTRAHEPFPRELLDDTARDAERESAPLRQLLDCRNRLARLEASVGDLVLDEGAQRVRASHRPVRGVAEVFQEVGVHGSLSAFFAAFAFFAANSMSGAILPPVRTSRRSMVMPSGAAIMKSAWCEPWSPFGFGSHVSIW